jgi:hypothetical protein
MLLELSHLGIPSQDMNLDMLPIQRYRNYKNMTAINIIIAVRGCHLVNSCMIAKWKSNPTAYAKSAY